MRKFERKREGYKTRRILKMPSFLHKIQKNRKLKNWDEIAIWACCEMFLHTKKCTLDDNNLHFKALLLVPIIHTKKKYFEQSAVESFIKKPA